ncbi:MAG TPA: Tex family protein [Pseudomonadales bacterium]|nr:Tex family protein [Pseudomonadales bacterium]
MDKIALTIAKELTAQPQQVEAAIKLLDEGATVPFIARYRKEATGGLDDTQLRTLDERLRYLREMEERRSTILNSIREQGKLTPELEQQIVEADSKTRLEDLYLPYKPKRRTKAQIAREAGLEPLALTLRENPNLSPEEEAAKFLNPEKEIKDIKAALDGAKQILMEIFSEDAELLAKLRHYLQEKAEVFAKVVEGKENEGAKFRDYFDHHEPISKIPSHRALAIFRGRNEGVLTIAVNVPEAEITGTMHPCEGIIAAHTGIEDRKRPADTWLLETVRWTWKIKLHSSLESELLTQVREAAEEEAIKVFSHNLKDLLMAAPAGQRVTLGLDPGLRTGVKVVVVDNTGQLLEHVAIFPHAPQNKWDESIKVLAHLCTKHNVDLISIGNGTASRETDKLATELLKKHPEIKAQKIVVSEAGASVYSASELAAKEFPKLDVSYRGAVSIARRLQDPLAELVKIDPKSIGVGQYQHDVSQTKLARSLDGVVEDCVNAVGVDVNTASVPLLARISGLNQTIAGNIVNFRNQNGAFKSRDELKKVPRLGDRTFEQAAGFLRIMNGSNPLDASAVHPEAYSVVERIVSKHAKNPREIIGDSQFLRSLKPAEFTDEKFGIPTVTDIIKELEKPGRDPRPEFKAAQFQEGVETLADLKLGMILEGQVTNVTNFGAFVDIGVHQDGLVHISVLSDKFVKDPREVVKAGDIVKVKVVEVDIPRKRIALSMRLNEEVGQKIDKPQFNQRPQNQKGSEAKQSQRAQPKAPAKEEKANGTFAALFANAKQIKPKK